MLNHLRFTLATLVFSLTCSVGLAVSDLVVNHTLAQTATISNEKAQADQLLQEGVQQFRRGEYLKALATYQRVLEISRRLNDEAGMAEALNNIGEVSSNINLFESQNEPLEVLQQALTIRRKLKDRRGEGETLDNIGSVYGILSQFDKQLSTLQQALAIRREVKDRVGEGITLTKIGSTYSNLKQHKKALEILQQAKAIHEELGDKYHLGITLFRIGGAYWRMNDDKNALFWYEQALTFNREIGSRAIENKSLSLIGSIYLLQKQYDRSLEYFKQANAVAQAIPDKSIVLINLQDLLDLYTNKVENYNVKGLVRQAKTEAKNTIEIAQSALSLARELKKPVSEANALTSLGRSYSVLGENQKAIELLEQALKIVREIKDINIEDTVLRYIESIYIIQGENILKIIELNKRQIEIAREQKDSLAEVGSLLALGTSYRDAGKYQLAISTCQEALAVAQKIDINKLRPFRQEYAQRIQIVVLQSLSDIYIRLGETDKALGFVQQGVKKAQSFNNPKLEAVALLYLSFVYFNVFYDNPKSIDAAQQALSIARKINEKTIEANALQRLGNNYEQQGNYTKALEASEQLLSLAKQLDNPQFEHNALDIFRDVYEAQGNLQKALLTAQQIVAITQQKNLGLFEGLALLNLSKSYLSVGDTTKAMESAQQALTIAKKQNNPSVEALVLNQIANAYHLRGEYQQGIAASQQSLDISLKNKNFQGEIGAVSTLGFIYSTLGEYQKSLAITEPYLPRLKQLNNRYIEAQLLSLVGLGYINIGADQKGATLIEQSLAIARELKNPALESTALRNLGIVYNSRSEYRKALELTQQSLQIAEKLNSSPLKIAPLSTLADIYDSLGDYKKSREYYQKVLENAKKLQNRFNEGSVLLDIANTYFAQEQPQKTVELSQQALTIFREIKEPISEAFAHRMLSVGYGELGNDASAMQEAQTFLTFARQTQNPALEKSALKLIGDLHRKFNRPSEAILSYQAALAIKTGTPWGIYAGLGQAYAQLNQPNEAIKNYQQAINTIEYVRRNIEGLSPELQSSFLLATVDFNKTKRADIYRQYAALLLKLGRTLEAQQVLELIKFQEVQDYLRAGEKPDGATNNQIIALGKELTDLETIPLEKRSNNQQQRIIELRKQQEKLAQEYGEFVKNPEIAKRIDELRQSTEGKNFDPQEQARRLQDSLKRLQQDAVIVYPLVLKDRLELILVTPYAPPIRRTVTVSETELNKTIEDFRRDLQSPGSNPVNNASLLYQWLIKPLESDLAAAKTKTIIFAPDGKLRYIPLAALHDGKQWLIERFDINNITALSLMDLNTKPQVKKQVLTAAFTDTSRDVTISLGGTNTTFRGLKYAGTEIDGITASIPGSTKLVNNQFNKNIVYQMNDYSIVHLATHAAFVDGQPEDSVILLGDGQYITLRNVESWNLPNVDLIVLSACETGLGGFGDGKEILGFGYQMQKIGAKAAIASLWQVDDPSTAQLMQQFYKNLALKPPITKAEALRQAQLSLLRNTSVKQDSQQRGGILPAPVDNARNQKVYVGHEHPYYWAPFILIGNGL